MDSFEHALNAWQALLDNNHVRTGRTARLKVERATFQTSQKIPAILRPGTREEVQECVKIANQFKVPLYPISTGKNWGGGSRVPVQDGCVLLDLGRLNRILDFDEKLAYVTVEPGVTQKQLHDFLQEQKANVFMCVTGGAVDTSLIGNIMERGDATGPYGDRFNHVCGLEVVLPTGKCVHTGFGRFSNSQTTPLYRWGVGPSLDGLFTQSNFGIVTQMTLWLVPIPEHLKIYSFSVDHEKKLWPIIDVVQQLKLKGVIRTTVSFWNDYKAISMMQQYPWDLMDRKVPLSPKILDHLRQQNNQGSWMGTTAIYAASQEQLEAEEQLLMKSLQNQVDHWKSLEASEFSEDAHRFLGTPQDLNVQSVYWRKRQLPPQELDPDRDGCGVIWCLPTIPFSGNSTQKVWEIVQKIVLSFQFEPSLAFLGIQERVLYGVVGIVYDRSLPGEDERAMACHDQLLQTFIEQGYPPYRLGIHSMEALPSSQDDTDAFLRNLKQHLDPHHILAPGRYEP